MFLKKHLHLCKTVVGGWGHLYIRPRAVVGVFIYQIQGSGGGAFYISYSGQWWEGAFIYQIQGSGWGAFIYQILDSG